MRKKKEVNGSEEVRKKKDSSLVRTVLVAPFFLFSLFYSVTQVNEGKHTQQSPPGNIARCWWEKKTK